MTEVIGMIVLAIAMTPACSLAHALGITEIQKNKNYEENNG
jgi:hypothetical protein